MGEELWLEPPKPAEPVSCPLCLMAHPFILAACPSNDKCVNPRQGRTQLRLVEAAVVGDPAADARVVHLRQILQGFVAAMMQRPAPDGPTNGRQRFRAGCRHEAVGSFSVPNGFPGPKLKEENQNGCWESRRAGLHPCSRGSSSSRDATPTRRPQNDLQARSTMPAPLRRFRSDKSHHPHSARMECASNSAPSTCRTRSARTSSPAEG